MAEESKGAIAALNDLGLTEAMVTLQTASCNTWAEAHDAGKLLQSRGWRSVIVVTDPPHIRRTDFSFKHAFAGTNLSFSLVSTQPEWWDVGGWWKSEVARQFVQSELVKIAFYCVKASVADAAAMFSVAQSRLAGLLHDDRITGPHEDLVDKVEALIGTGGNQYLVGGAGDSVTADVLTRAIDDCEMRSVAIGFQYLQCFGADLQRFASAIHMVIVIGGFDEGSGEHGEMPLPEAGGVWRIDRSPSVIGSIQP